MIIVQLQGGLGNQMFQYALGKNLSIKNNDKLRLDLIRYPKKSYLQSIIHAQSSSLGRPANSPPSIEVKVKSNLSKLKRKYLSLVNENQYGTDTKRSYSLGHFNITGKKLSHWDIIHYKLNKHLFKYEVDNDAFGFDEKFLNLKGNLYLEGYWQNINYFKEIEGVLRNEFTVITPPSEYNKDLLEKVNFSNSVSLHVRRGDYVAEDEINAKHGTASNNYYLSAIKLMKEKVENPTFFIFSDDPEWAKNNIKTECPTFVSTNSGDKDYYEDLRLMYSCKHNIIANSSYSWWGAFLNTNKNKIVTCPENWMTNIKSKDIDLIPPEWVII